MLTERFLTLDLSTERFGSEDCWRPGLADRSEGSVWLIEVRGPANRSEGVGARLPLVQGPSIKVRGLPIEVRG